MPFCSPENVCVECLQNDHCPSTKPACDASHVCRECISDDDCASTVCDLTVGTCTAEEKILYATPTGSDAATCTKTDPCSISHAVALVDATKQTVKAAPGNYTVAFTLDTGKTIIIDGFGATLSAPAGQRNFDIVDGSRLRLVGLTLINSSTSGAGVTCQAASPCVVDLEQVSIDCADTAILMYPGSATIDRSYVRTRQSTKVTLLAINASITVTRSTIDGGYGSIAEGAQSILRITNSVIKNQATLAYAGASILGSTDYGSAFVSFSTVINAPVPCGSGSPRCAGGTDYGSCTENTIILNGGASNSIQGACVVNHSIVYPQSTSLGGVGNQIGVDPLLVDFANASYHLMPTSPAIDAADPAATTAIDYDGVARPQGPRSDIGAFEYKP